MKTLLLLGFFTLCSCVKNEGSVTSGSSTNTPNLYFSCTNSSSESTAELYSFYKDGRVKLEMMFYTLPDCAVSGAKERNFFTGTYSYNKDTGLYTETFNKLQVAFLSTSEVNSRNSASYCGFSNWTKDQLKDITDNENCSDGTVYSNATPVPYNGTTLNEEEFSNSNGTHTRVN